MSDDYIISKLINFDEWATKEYFYGYCRRAYNIYNYKYQLDSKVGLDFYSLAHEYYIQLLTHDFKQLKDRPKDMKLSTWMIGGFRFVVLDALKAYNKEFEAMGNAASDDVLDYVRSTDKEEGLMEAVAAAVVAHYNDRIMREVAYGFFVQGYKQKEISERLGITPSAVNQRYKKMMDEVVTPFVIENYGSGIYLGAEKMSEERNLICFDASSSGVFYSPKLGLFMEENTDMDITRITPDFITSLEPNQIFVFGSNLRGIHAGGAARMAVQHFGAVMGNGVGIQGQSYAIPTMQGGVETIRPYVDEFIKYAKEHQELQFLVTPIGCGIAGFYANDIAPLFRKATDLENVYLPESFWYCLE